MNKDLLIQKSIEAMELSYSPYSNFKVGAAILLKDGNIILGANIENASYGLTMCAERNTVFKTILSGYKVEDMVAMALCADADEVPYPCGACRQVMAELLNSNTPVYLTNVKGDVKETTVGELLPYSFSGSDL